MNISESVVLHSASIKVPGSHRFNLWKYFNVILVRPTSSFMFNLLKTNEIMCHNVSSLSCMLLFILKCYFFAHTGHTSFSCVLCDPCRLPTVLLLQIQQLPITSPPPTWSPVHTSHQHCRRIYIPAHFYSFLAFRPYFLPLSLSVFIYLPDFDNCLFRAISTHWLWHILIGYYSKIAAVFE